MAQHMNALRIPDLPMVSPEVANLLPFGLARRLRSVPISAGDNTITVITASPEDVHALDEIRTITGRNVEAIPVPAADVDQLLEYLSGRADSGDLWLQSRHITALSRIADTSLNLGQADAVRSLVDRALEFAPYSAELWLTRARVATHPADVVAALNTAAQTAPHDLRILRWRQTLEDSEEAVTDSSSLPDLNQDEPTGRSGDSALTDTSFEAAREIETLNAPAEIARRTAEGLLRLSQAESASVYFRTRNGWLGESTDCNLQAHLRDALPKANRIAAQVVRQGLPVLVSDTSTRLGDIGPLISRTSVGSFALLPILGGAKTMGLAYINFATPGRAAEVFDPAIAAAIEVILNAAAARLTSVTKGGKSSREAIDELTDTYTAAQFRRMLEAEIERARRYRFSVSILLLDFAGREGAHSSPDDRLLINAAQAICKVARGSDVIARGQLSAFAVLLPQTTALGAERLARRMDEVIRPLAWVPGGGTAVRVGAATFPDEGESADALLGSAWSSLQATARMDSQENVSSPAGIEG